MSNQLNNQASSPEADGLNRHKPPFLCDDEERLAEERLDDFMANIIIPLAARTKAIVIVDAFPSSCILSRSLMRIVAAHRSRWGGVLPFWIFAMTSAMFNMYQNPDPKARWRFARQHCRAWRHLDPIILQAMTHKCGQPQETEDGTLIYNGNHVTKHDLPHEASVLILGDNIDSNEPTGEFSSGQSFESFRITLRQFLSTKLPCVAIQTGSIVNKIKSKRNPAGVFTEFDESLALVISGMPLVYVDMRKREPIGLDVDRADRIAKAKMGLIELQQKL